MTEESKPEQVKQEETKQEEPKQEEPKQEEPKQEEPKQEEPKQEELRQEGTRREEAKPEKDKKAIWWRGLYMVLFAFLVSIAKMVVVAIVVFQFITVLITDKPNEQLHKFSKGLAKYIYEIVLYLTFNSEQQPFPMGPWPGEDTDHTI